MTNLQELVRKYKMLPPQDQAVVAGFALGAEAAESELKHAQPGGLAANLERGFSHLQSLRLEFGPNDPSLAD